MTDRMDLLGKTISGVVAVPRRGRGGAQIWMLQFTDGTHVEFVSPGAQRALRKLAAGRRERTCGHAPPDPQLALNVA